MFATGWINQNIRDSDKLNKNILNSISDFVLMWAIFEASEGADSGILERIPQLARDISQRAPDNLIDEHLLYWSDRYITNGKPNQQFSRLKFRDIEQSKLVFNVLSNCEESSINKISAALFIIYRYRNNLFHGLKDITKLNTQLDNLNNAIEVLQKTLPYSGRYIFLGVNTI
ncbi:MAG: hypothetical protein EOM46_12650 [Gammaproteobacteria bacterium]|nr:hypothetical protein [Gammaproteobacteria bacterium]